MRFNLRDLFWLTVVVALALGWGISAERLRTTKRHAEALRDALYNADQNREMYKLGLDLEHGSPLPVDWELATREIP